MDLLKALLFNSVCVTIGMLFGDLTIMYILGLVSGFVASIILGE